MSTENQTNQLPNNSLAQTEMSAGMLIGRDGDISSKRVCGLLSFLVAVGLVVWGAVVANSLMLEGAKMLLYFATACLVGGTAAERLDGLRMGRGAHASKYSTIREEHRV